MANGKGGPEFSIGLETNDPELHNNDLAIIITVLQKRFAPDPPQDVIVLLNGTEIARTNTDPDGHITTTITLPGPGSYRIIAQLETMPSIRVTRLVTIKKPDTKKSAKAVKISVRVIGKCGEQKLFICAIAEDGSLVPDAKFILLDGGTPLDFTTDKSGMYVYSPVNLVGERTIRVLIGENDPTNKQRAWDGVLTGR